MLTCLDYYTYTFDLATEHFLTKSENKKVVTYSGKFFGNN
jgi:hypothetical protein